MPFISAVNPLETTQTDNPYCLFLGQEKIVLTAQGSIPRKDSIQTLLLAELGEPVYLGTLNGVACQALELSSETSLDNSLSWVSMREAFRTVSEEQMRVMGYARSILDWNQNFRFCGACGQPTEPMENERAKICHSCGVISYPRISPAIIVAITRGRKILLARSARFHDSEMYSVLAGFVEPAETLEECVAREVMEEVGMSLKNIRYFGSQSWPFPDSLMIGFTAEYASGSINIDTHELVDAKWFPFDALPKIPQPPSLSSKLINWFVQKNL